MAKQKVVRRAPACDPSCHCEEEPSQRPKRSLVMRIGISILGLAVIISSLVPLLSLFDRQPPAEANPVAQLEEAARQNPQDANFQVMLGNAHYDAQRYAEAATAYQKALALKPGDPNVQVDYGTSLFYSGQADAALKEYRAVLKTNPNHFQAHLNLGVVYRSQGKQGEAIASWRKAEQLAPDAQTKQHVAEMINLAVASAIAK